MAELLLAMAAGLTLVAFRDRAENYYNVRALPGEPDNSDETYIVDDGVPPGMQAKYRLFKRHIQKNFPVGIKSTAPRPYPFREPFTETYRATLESPAFFESYAANYAEGHDLPHPLLDPTRSVYPYPCRSRKMHFIGGSDDRNILASITNSNDSALRR